MDIIGHRGAMGYEPENTISSFERALNLGVNGIELEVYQCKSGELIVFHDDTLGRLTGAEGFVWDKTLTELKELEVKHPIPDAAKAEHGKITIPTLEEVLNLVYEKSPGTFINVEIKKEGIAKEVYDAAKKHIDAVGNYDRIIISSFYNTESQRVKMRDDKIRIGALFSGVFQDYKFAREMGASSLHADIDAINHALVREAHDPLKGKLKVYVWTVNEPWQMDKIVNLGADGIFTNFPDRARDYINLRNG
ncbi:MAG TPA: glycerophosphodiester phosphodiesterase family protein [Candidatus Nanoarchaeia archaeon]|nr:glycerophosphodiester phosphodiesterase family protein [Candidatus Nanoarchaeia archaeon]